MHSNVHRCAFKVPKNPKFQCPREAKYYDAVFRVWHCKHHDTLTKKRCQEFSAVYNMQCPELGTIVDPKSSKKYCTSHSADIAAKALEIEPESIEDEISMSDEDAIAPKDTPPSPDGGPNAIPVAEYAIVAKLEETMPFPKDENNAIPMVKPDAQAEKAEKAKPSELPTVEPYAQAAQGEKVKLSELPKPHVISLSKSLIGKEDITLRPVQINPRSATPEAIQLPKRVAASYVQCNICLEKHDASEMRGISGCQHQFRESCLRAILGSKNMRRYFCSNCAAWIAELCNKGLLATVSA